MMSEMLKEEFERYDELRDNYCLLAIEYAVMKHEQGWNLERIKKGYLEFAQVARETKKEQG
jgi:hypothetical protein